MKRVWGVAGAAAGLALIGQAAQAQPAVTDQPLLKAVAGEVSADHERETIAALVGFGTRSTISDATSKTRGIGAARSWAAGQFAAISQACGGCLRVETPAQTVTGPRILKPTAVVDVLGIQRGATDPDRVIVISGHIDSMPSNVLDPTTDAPGANDDGSGTAAVLEAARVLSKHKFAATIVYAVLSGEEQGLYGGKVLADYAVQQGWRVEADLNNDIVGNTHGQWGVMDNTHVRVFSEGTRSTETPAQAASRNYHGGEVDSPSRNLARYIERLADAYVDGFQVKMVYRTDRFGRGGDQVEFLKQGFPAVRITEAAENYTRQHQTVRVENGIHYGDVLEGVDFPYLAQVTRVNVVTLAALASAPEPPHDVSIARAPTGTTVTWAPTPGAAAYRVWWRDTIEPRWSHSRLVSSGESVLLDGVDIDNWLFGVSAVSADGFETPVVFPGVVGTFERLPPAAQPAPFMAAAPAAPRK